MLACVLSCCAELTGEDFAIRTRIYARGDARPIAENLTVFQSSKIYDFQRSEPRSVSVFDVDSRRFLLAIPDEGIQTTVAADELIRFAADEQAKAAASASELVKFAANPRFEEEYQADQRRLLLTSPVWNYQVEAIATASPDVLHRYSQFANWFTYLNAMFSPLPPAVRLELNRSLDRHACLPSRVIVQVKRDGKVLIERESRHELIAALGPDQRQPISDWLSQQPDLRYVDFATYRQSLVTRINAADK
jgi:hypothetical protein